MASVPQHRYILSSFCVLYIIALNLQNPILIRVLLTIHMSFSRFKIHFIVISKNCTSIQEMKRNAISHQCPVFIFNYLSCCIIYYSCHLSLIVSNMYLKLLSVEDAYNSSISWPLMASIINLKRVWLYSPEYEVNIITIINGINLYTAVCH